MNEIIDISRDSESGEVTQFTIIDSTGQPQLMNANPENMLLYDPEDELPFEDGMYSLLNGERAFVLSEDDPLVMIAPTDNKYCYILRVRDRTVETVASQSERVLRGVRNAVIDNDVSALVSVHDDIVAKQVRRDIIDSLMQTFDERDRLSKTERGWLVDDFYLVNWEASLYTLHNDPDEADYKRGSGGIKKTDTSYEFVQLSIESDVSPVEVVVNGSAVRLSEREMLFLSKIKWLLNRREQHPDLPFWMFSDRYSSVDWKTGQPESDDDEDEDDEESVGMNL
jgi:hypothetical protein